MFTFYKAYYARVC